MRVTNKAPVFKTLLNNLANLAQLKGMEYFILLMIGTVTYDGLRETTFWFNIFGSRTYETFFSTIAFLSMNLIVIVFYRFACYFAIKVSGEDIELNEISLKFGHTMLPIAFAYHVRTSFIKTWIETNTGFVGSEVVDLITALDGTMYATTYNLGIFITHRFGGKNTFGMLNASTQYLQQLMEGFINQQMLENL